MVNPVIKLTLDAGPVEETAKRIRTALTSIQVEIDKTAQRSRRIFDNLVISDRVVNRLRGQIRAIQKQISFKETFIRVRIDPSSLRNTQNQIRSVYAETSRRIAFIRVRINPTDLQTLRTQLQSIHHEFSRSMAFFRLRLNRNDIQQLRAQLQAISAELSRTNALFRVRVHPSDIQNIRAQIGRIFLDLSRTASLIRIKVHPTDLQAVRTQVNAIFGNLNRSFALFRIKLHERDIQILAAQVKAIYTTVNSRFAVFRIMLHQPDVTLLFGSLKNIYNIVNQGFARFRIRLHQPDVTLLFGSLANIYHIVNQGIARFRVRLNEKDIQNIVRRIAKIYVDFENVIARFRITISKRDIQSITERVKSLRIQVGRVSAVFRIRLSPSDVNKIKSQISKLRTDINTSATVPIQKQQVNTKEATVAASQVDAATRQSTAATNANTVAVQKNAQAVSEQNKAKASLISRLKSLASNTRKTGSSNRDYTASTESASEATSRFREKMRELSRTATLVLGPLNGIGARVIALSGIASGAGASVAGLIGTLVGAGGLVAATVKTAQNIDTLRKSAQIAGVTFETLQVLSYAASQEASARTDEFAQALQAFSRRTGQLGLESGPLVKALKAINVEYREFQNLSTYKRLLLIADATKKLGSTAQQNALIADTFGRRFIFLQRLFVTGSEGIEKYREIVEKLGITISDETAIRATQLADAVDKLGRQFSAAGTQFLAPFIDELVTLSNLLSDLASFLSKNNIRTDLLGFLGVGATVGGTIGAISGGGLIGAGIGSAVGAVAGGLAYGGLQLLASDEIETSVVDQLEALREESKRVGEAFDTLLDKIRSFTQRALDNAREIEQRTSGQYSPFARNFFRQIAQLGINTKNFDYTGGRVVPRLRQVPEALTDVAEQRNEVESRIQELRARIESDYPNSLRGQRAYEARIERDRLDKEEIKRLESEKKRHMELFRLREQSIKDAKQENQFRTDSAKEQTKLNVSLRNVEQKTLNEAIVNRQREIEQQTKLIGLTRQRVAIEQQMFFLEQQSRKTNEPLTEEVRTRYRDLVLTKDLEQLTKGVNDARNQADVSTILESGQRADLRYLTGIIGSDDLRVGYTNLREDTLRQAAQLGIIDKPFIDDEGRIVTRSRLNKEVVKTLELYDKENQLRADTAVDKANRMRIVNLENELRLRKLSNRELFVETNYEQALANARAKGSHLTSQQQTDLRARLERISFDDITQQVSQQSEQIRRGRIIEEADTTILVRYKDELIKVRTETVRTLLNNEKFRDLFKITNSGVILLEKGTGKLVNEVKDLNKELQTKAEKKFYRDLQKQNMAMERETELLMMSNNERMIQSSLYNFLAKAKKEAIKLDHVELELLAQREFLEGQLAKRAEYQQSISQNNFNKGLHESIKALKQETELLLLSNKERFIRERLDKKIAQANKTSVVFSDADQNEYRQFLGQQFDIRQIIEDAKRAAEAIRKEWERIFKDFNKGFREAFSELFIEILDGGYDQFKNFSDRIRNVFVKLASDIATLLVFRPVLSGLIGSLGLGGLATALGAPPGVAHAAGISSTAAASVPGGIAGSVGASAISGLGFSDIAGLGKALVSGSLSINYGAQAIGDSIASYFGIGQYGGLEGITGSTIGDAFGGAFSVGGILGGIGGNIAANALFGGNRSRDQQRNASYGGIAGSLAGSFLIPVPVLGTAIGGFLGNALGGLFGGGRKKPRTSQETHQQIEAELTRFFEGTGLPLPDFARVRNRFHNTDTLRDGVLQGHLRVVIREHPAVEALANEIDGLNGVIARIDVENMSKAAEQFNFAVQYLTGALDFETDDITQGEQAIKEINERFEELTKTAKELDLSTQRLVTSRNMLLDHLRSEFDLGIQQAILSFTDPLQALLDAQEATNQIRIRDAIALGGNLAEVERLSGLERQKIIEEFNSSVASNIKNLVDYLNSLFAGPQSPLAPSVVFRNAQAQFSEVRQGALQGDPQAIERLQDAGGNLLAASETMFASSEQFFNVFSLVTETLRQVIDAQSGGQIQSTGQDALSSSNNRNYEQILPVGGFNSPTANPIPDSENEDVLNVLQSIDATIRRVDRNTLELAQR